MHLAPGGRVDRYTLVKPLGEGGQGSVWKVIDPLDGGKVRALKIIDPANAGATAFARARREAKVLAQLRHPGLVACHGFYEDPATGLACLVLDLIKGRSLTETADDPRIRTTHRLALLGHIAATLAHVHAAGLVHRDLKPDNILVSDDFWSAPDRPGSVKVVDFGIAAPLGNPRPLTVEGSVIGTLPYFAPEMVDPATWGRPDEGCARDLFAFGVIAYRLLCGIHPTGLQPSATAVDYARAYKAASAGLIPWPPRGIDGPWGVAVRACLALRWRDRPDDGAALERIVQTGIDPKAHTIPASTSAYSAPTSEGPPASRTPVSQAPESPAATGAYSSPASSPAQAVTATTAPPTPRSEPRRPKPPPPSYALHPPVVSRRRAQEPAPKRTSFLVYLLAAIGAVALLAIFTFIGFVWYAVQKSSPPPPYQPVGITPSPPTATSPAATPVVSTCGVPCCGGSACEADEQNRVSISQYCRAGDLHCRACNSGRAECVPNRCDSPLPLERPWLLRVAGAVVMHGGRPKNVYDLWPGAKVCVQRPNVDREPRCTRLADTQIPGAAEATRLPVTTADLLTGRGISIYVEDGSGRPIIPSFLGYHNNAIKNSALCLGLLFRNGEDHVDFFLDDP